MAVDFSTPLRYRHWKGEDGVIYWNATWDASNFDQAIVSAYWGDLGRILEGRLILVDEITLKVVAANAGASYTPQFTTLPGTNQAMPGGQTWTTAAATEYLNWQPRGYYMVSSGQRIQVGLVINASGYASTDDLVLYVSGKAIKLEECIKQDVM